MGTRSPNQEDGETRVPRSGDVTLFAGAPARLEGRVRAWAAAGSVPEGAAIKEGEAYRVDSLFVKLFRDGKHRFFLRPSKARRAAHLHAKLSWVPVPAPLCLLDLRRALPSGVRGVLVTRFIDGQTLGEVRRNPDALLRLAELLARMHERGLHHGDLHPGNLIWDRERWWLLDLDGIRPPSHRLLGKRASLRQWGRLLLNLDREAALLLDPFHHYVSLRPSLGEAAPLWNELPRIADEVEARRKRRR
ncbi:MAG TPA: hypothetical protein ENJ09_11805 [Planctomycetes bacterium]|nr:hypothetical protein [Planctomycetota bacterium]